MYNSHHYTYKIYVILKTKKNLIRFGRKLKINANEVDNNFNGYVGKLSYLMIRCKFTINEK